MILNYEIISSPKVNYGKSYIDYKRKRLVIRDIPLPDKKYAILMKKPRIISDGDGVYIAFVPERLNPACKVLSRSDFGYYTVDISDVMNKFYIKGDVNVELKLEEKDELVTIYEIVI